MPPDDSSNKPPSSPAGMAGGVWQPPVPEALQEYFPQYEIVALLGRGGMGAVYKGWQRSLDRFVAIKILPPGMDDAEVNYAERFKQEAKSMAKLMHPGIVAVFDAGETPSGLLYFVMEFVEGTDVSHMVQSQGKLPPEHALAITAHVCDALQYAHTHGIVHRDIKPANIMVNMEGAVKVADFGLAKHSDPAVGGLTKTNMAMGTPDFVAPEALIPGVNLDGRADLYAVGVMLYQMLTGSIPRGMFTMPSMMVKTDPRFDAIIAKAMQADREVRYDSAAALRRDLDVIMTVPLAKAGDAHSGAAIPKHSLPQKPAGRPPQSPQGQSLPGGPPNRAPRGVPGQAARPNVQPKSGLGPVIGIAATAVIGAGLFFLFSKGSSDKKGEAGKNDAPRQEPAAVQTSGDAFIREVAALAPEEQVKRVVAELRRLNPGYDGGATHKVEDGKVTEFIIPVMSIANVADISPLRALAELEHLRCHGSSATGTKGKIRDLSPIAGLKLKALFCNMNPLNNLSPLRGMPLYVLDIGDTEVSDLSPLQGMPLTSVKFGNTKVQNLSPLRGMALESLDTRGTTIADLSPLQGMKLQNLSTDSNVRDFSVLRGMPLKRISGNMDRTRDGELLRSITTLEFINGIPAKEWFGSAPVAPATTPSAPAAALTFGGHRYQFFPDKLSWTEAKAKAESMGGHLATITSKEENDWIVDTFIKALPQGRGLWIGGTSEGTPGKWRWITGEPFAFTAWGLNEPGNSSGEPVINFSFIGQGMLAWEDIGYEGVGGTDHRGGYLVEWDSAGEPASATAPAATGDVRTFNGHRYLFVPDKLSWTEAKAKAEAMGGHLATLENAAEFDWLLKNVIAAALPGEVTTLWLGASRQSQETSWQWVTGSSVEPAWAADNLPDVGGKWKNIFGDFPAYLTVLRKKGTLLLDDISDTSASDIHWRITNKGFLVEWDDAGKPAATGDVRTFNGHRYQLVPEKALAWSEAKAKAEKMGGHLATITSKEEDDFVRASFCPATKISGKWGTSFWLGASRATLTSEWLWVTGEPFKFTGWGTGEPNANPGDGSPCAMAYAYGSGSYAAEFGWNDIGPQAAGNSDWATPGSIGYLVEWDEAADQKPMVSSFAPEIWTDWLAEQLRSRKLPDGTISKDGGIRVVKEKTSFAVGPAMKDGAVRVTFRRGSARTLMAAVRSVDMPGDIASNALWSAYRAQDEAGLARLIYRDKNSAGPEPLGDWDNRGQVDPAQEHVMEIRAVSTQLTLRYDGKVVLEKTDARLDRGLPTIYAEKDGWIRKIEVLNLDATSIPATLLTQYTAALTRARDAANTSPADKAACQAELARLKTSPSIPAGDAPDIPAALKNLRNVVRKELEKLPPPAAR